MRHATLSGYAADVLGLCAELDLRDVVLVGHSVSSMIAVLAHNAAPDLVTGLVLVVPSARYLDDVGYVGGFSDADVTDLVESLETNHLGWQAPLAGLVAGEPGAVAEELEESFCRMRPDIASRFAEVTFRGDNRTDLADVRCPTLVLQSARDAVAPASAVRFVHEHIASSRLVVIDTVGHVPHLTAPDETVTQMLAFLAG